ncbi:hypothetical protein RB653_004474 [Dictyostelium firmibasis]|uniref:START domain-containing protein n=1 Tax=Dictyostelium firmibasis TaxID=79012 RepID=A0AAN7UAL3_9MYCE
MINNSVIEYIENIENQYNEIIKLCNLEKLRSAYNNLLNLEQLLETIQNNITEHNNNDHNDELYLKLEELIKKIKLEERLIKLKQEAIEIEDLLKVLSSDYKSQGWQSIQNVDGIHSMYKEHGSGIHSVRIEGIIDQPIFNVCSIIMEADLYYTWIPRLLESRILNQDDRFKRLIYCRASCPWPVSDRDICLYGYGVDMLEEENQVVVVSRSIRDQDLIGNSSLKNPETFIPQVRDNTVRAKSEISGFTIKPISATQTYVQVVSLTDPNMKLLPKWLLNFVTTQFCHYLFVMLRKQASDVASSKEYQSRIESNPIYKEIKEKSDSYFNRIDFQKENNNNNNNNNLED